MQSMHQNHIFFWPSFKRDSAAQRVFSVGLPHPCGSWARQRDPLSRTRPITPSCQEQHTAKQWATGFQKRMRSPSLGHNWCPPRATLLPQPHLVRQPQGPEELVLGTCAPDTSLGWGVLCTRVQASFLRTTRWAHCEMDSQSGPKHRFLIYNARSPCICGTSSWADRA